MYMTMYLGLEGYGQTPNWGRVMPYSKPQASGLGAFNLTLP